MNANSPKTIREWLKYAQAELQKADIPSAQLDTLVLLEYSLKKNKATLLAHDDNKLTGLQLVKLNNLLKERKQRVPIAYLTKNKEFYGRNFYIDERVLVPRPESESFVELIKELSLSSANILDVGCGSGILGITLKLELPDYKVTLSDNSLNALVIARKNAKKLNTDVNFIEQDLLGIGSTKYNVILANLPYVPIDLNTQPELEFEPQEALYSDDYGVAHYQRFWKQIPSNKAQFVLTESLEIQHDAIGEFANKAGYRQHSKDGLVQLFKKT